MKIRRATDADIHKLSRLWLSLCTEHHPSYHPDVNAWKSITLVLLHSPNFASFVAEEGGKIIGFLDLEIFTEPSNGKVYAGGRHLYVSPEYRTSPAAGLLYRSAIKEAKARGADAIQLICFDETKDMWLHHGYQPIHTIMEKSL